MHECWDAVNSGNVKHSSLPLIMKGLQNYDFQKVILIHLNPEWTLAEQRIIHNQIIGTKYCLGKDGKTFDC